MPAPNITNEQRVRPISEFTNNQLLNIIRNNAAPEYQKRIPAATQSSIHDVMNGIMSSTSLKNEFYNQLVNVIGQQYVNTWRWNNPLKIFERASMEYGDTYEEIAVGMPMAQVYDPQAEYLGADNFRKWKVPVDALYYRPDFQHFYPVTTDDKMLRRAFYNESSGLSTLFSQLITSCYNAAEVDLFESMCSLFVEYARMGGYWRVHMDNDLNDMGSSETDARDMLRQIRAWADNLKFVTTKYNARHMPIAAQPDELVLFCSPEVKSALDVQGLATVFQRTDAEPTVDRIITIPADRFGMDGVQAILTTDKFFVAIPQLREMTTQTNPVNINSVNHYLHVWEILGVSGFQPAVLFWTGEGSTEKVTLPTGTTASTPRFEIKLGMYEGQETTPSNVSRGDIVQVVADTTITNDNAATWRSNAVRYELAPSAKPYSEWTYVTPTGMVVCGLDEPNTTIKVTATADYVDPATPEVSNSVSAALDIPVVGAGVIGFSPSLVTAIQVADVTVANTKDAQAHAMAVMLDGRKVDVSHQAAWQSDTPANATVSDTGLVHGVKAGAAKLTATLFGVSGQGNVTVS